MKLDLNYLALSVESPLVSQSVCSGVLYPAGTRWPVGNLKFIVKNTKTGKNYALPVTQSVASSNTKLLTLFNLHNYLAPIRTNNAKHTCMSDT